MKTAFLYHRYSTDIQKNGYSLEFQRNITKKLSEKYDCKIIQVYEDEGISGATIDKRPSMLQLLSDMKELKPEYIICVDQDRIARGNDFWYIKNLMSQNNVSFITEKEGVINFTENVSSDFMSDILAAAAKYERGMIKQRIKRAIAERANRGLFVGNCSIIHGYKYKDGNIIVDEEEAKLIKKIFEMSVNGMGYSGIARYLNRQGIKSKRNGYFTAERIRYILENPLYCGYIRHGDEIYKGVHKPIIDEVTFKKAQINIARYKRINKTKPTKYLLTGFLKCGYCGANLGGNFKKDNGGGKPTTIYRCNGYVRGLCTSPVYLKKEKIENYVISKVIKKIEELKLNFDDKVIDLIKSPSISKLDIAKQKKKLQSKADKLLEEYLDGFIDKGRYRQYINDINKKVKNLKEDKVDAIDYYILKNIDVRKTFEESDINDKRKIISLVLNKIEVFRMNGTYRLEDRIKCYWNEIK